MRKNVRPLWQAPAQLRLAAALSFLLVLPFAVLEWRNGASPTERFPVALFVVLWLIPFAGFSIGPVFSSWAERPAAVRVLAGAVLLFLAGIWIAIVRDQLPCFLGVPNCD